jgi:hypothetical protein
LNEIVRHPKIDVGRPIVAVPNEIIALIVPTTNVWVE